MSDDFILVCPQGHDAQLPNSIFCKDCGSEMVKRTASVCPNCGHDLIPGQRYCDQCGARLTEKTKDEIAKDEAAVEIATK